MSTPSSTNHAADAARIAEIEAELARIRAGTSPSSLATSPSLAAEKGSRPSPFEPSELSGESSVPFPFVLPTDLSRGVPGGVSRQRDSQQANQDTSNSTGTSAVPRLFSLPAAAGETPRFVYLMPEVTQPVSFPKHREHWAADGDDRIYTIIATVDDEFPKDMVIAFLQGGLQGYISRLSPTYKYSSGEILENEEPHEFCMIIRFARTAVNNEAASGPSPPEDRPPPTSEQERSQESDGSLPGILARGELSSSSSSDNSNGVSSSEDSFDSQACADPFSCTLPDWDPRSAFCADDFLTEDDFLDYGTSRERLTLEAAERMRNRGYPVMHHLVDGEDPVSSEDEEEVSTSNPVNCTVNEEQEPPMVHLIRNLETLVLSRVPMGLNARPVDMLHAVNSIDEVAIFSLPIAEDIRRLWARLYREQPQTFAEALARHEEAIVDIGNILGRLNGEN